MKTARLLATVVAALLAASAAPAQETAKVVLEWKFAKGATTRYELSQKSDIVITGVDISQEILYGFVLEVADVDEAGAASFKLTFDRTRIRAVGPLNDDFDSATAKKDPEGILGKAMKALVGKSCTFRMDKRGDIRKFEGFQKVIAGVLENAEEDDAGVADISAALFTDDQFKQTLHLMLGNLPKTPVAKGGTWNLEDKFPIPMVGKLSMRHTLTLGDLRADGKEAVIDQKSKIELSEAEEGAGAFEITDGKYEAQMIWLVEKGMVQSAKGSLSMELSMSGQDIVSKTKFEIKVAPK